MPTTAHLHTLPTARTPAAIRQEIKLEKLLPFPHTTDEEDP